MEKRGVLQQRRSSRGRCELALEFVHSLCELVVAFHVPGQAADGREDRAVVTAAEPPADLGKALVGELACEVDRDLACM